MDDSVKEFFTSIKSSDVLISLDENDGPVSGAGETFALYAPDDAAAAPEGTAFESGMTQRRAQSGVDSSLLMELYAAADNDVKQTFDSFFAENPDIADLVTRAQAAHGASRP